MQGQKVLGWTILSSQYIEKYWGECPHCLYWVGAYAWVCLTSTCEGQLEQMPFPLTQNFRGKGPSLGNIFLVSTKPDTFCYLIVQPAPCYVQSFWHNTGVWQTDGRTELL